jgi:hypothetical protein
MRLTFVALLCLSALAQTLGNLGGRVLDPSGAVLGGVRVSVKNVETGLTREVRSDNDGNFTASALAAGRYEIRAELERFRPLVQQNVVLTVGESRTLNLTMELGAVDQELTVVGAPPTVNTSTSELSYLVEEAVIRELPLNGRNYTDLALLQPGVISYPHRDGGSAVAHGLGMSINGQDPRSNVYLLDGTPLNDFTNGPAGSAAGTVLGAETVREFRVETNAYSAEFGRNSGGQINALTKSGSNELHGSAYYFHRNDNFDARNFFDPSDNPEFKRNQYGATVGGRIVRDKSFFFLGHEGLREALGRTIISDVPDLDARRGLVNGVQYTIDPTIRPYLDEYPLPNGPNRGGGVASYTFGFTQRLTQDFGQGRYDHIFNDRHHMFGRYTYDGAIQRLPTDYPQFPRDFLSRNQFVTLTATQILSERTLNHLRLGFSRTRIGQDVEANTSQQLTPFVPGRSLIGNIDVGGLQQRFGPQGSVNLRLVQNVYGVEDGLVMERGRHRLKTGFLVERYQDNMINPTFSLGQFTFNDLPGFLQNRPARFLGLSPNGALDRYWRFTLFALYLQDDFKVHPRVTINAGLRYEFTTMPIDLYGRDSALPDLTAAAPTTGQLYQNPTYKNISPRIGGAWDVFGTGRTAIRAGYGLYFNTNNQQNLIVTVTNPPATPRLSIANNPTFTNLAFPVPDFARGIGNTIRPVQWDLKNPRVHVFNMNVQQTLWKDVVLTVGYAGSRGQHLLRSADVNTTVPVRQADGTLFFPAGAPRRNPNFSTIELKSSDGSSWYNAGILEIRKRYSNGMSFQTSYTFSRNIDTTQASTFFSDATNGTTTAFPEFEGFEYNRGLAEYHAKHNWVTNFTWELPFGRNLTGPAAFVARGWQLSGIGHVRSGNPLTVFVRANRSRTQWAPSLGPGIGNDRPNMAPGRTYESAILGRPDAWFDPTAFVLQPAGYLGSSGRGAFIGPNLRAVDLAAMKNFRAAEQVNVQFRAEAFNLLNRANFGPPNLTAFAGTTDNEAALPTFGRVRSTVTSARQIQLGLRISF